MDFAKTVNFKLLFAIPLLLFVGIVLTYPSDTELNASRPVKSVTRTLADFESKLKAEMTLVDLKATFGEPQEEKSQDAVTKVYFYSVKEGGRVLIGYKDKILFANYEDPAGLQSRILKITPSPDITSGSTAPQFEVGSTAPTQ